MYYILNDNDEAISLPQIANHRAVRRVLVTMTDEIEALRGSDFSHVPTLSEIQAIDSNAIVIQAS